MLFTKSSARDGSDVSTITAILWLMTRYQQFRCKRIACLIEQHLDWLAKYSNDPELMQACEKLQVEWRTVITNARQPTSPSRH